MLLPKIIGDCLNIFILSEDPVEAAQLQCDKHVVKMVLESAQLLSTAHRLLDGKEGKQLSSTGKTMRKAWFMPKQEDEILYSATHVNHPCAIWTRNSNKNYMWLYNHFIALCNEYTFRYNKTHLTDSKLRKRLQHIPMRITIGEQTEFVTATGDIKLDNPVNTYRQYYKNKQNDMTMCWTKRNVPEWFMLE